MSVVLYRSALRSLSAVLAGFCIDAQIDTVWNVMGAQWLKLDDCTDWFTMNLRLGTGFDTAAAEVAVMDVRDDPFVGRV